MFFVFVFPLPTHGFPGVVAHTANPSSWEAGVDGALNSRPAGAASRSLSKQSTEEQPKQNEQQPN